MIQQTHSWAYIQKRQETLKCKLCEGRDQNIVWHIVSTVDPWTVWGLGAPVRCTTENLHVTLQSALYIGGSTTLGSTSLRSCSTVVCICWKNPHISGPAQFKPMLFKGQLYISNEKEWLIATSWKCLQLEFISMDTSVPLHFLEFVSFSRVYFVALKQQFSAGEVPTPLGGIWKYGDVFRAMARLGSGTVAFSGLGAKDPRCSVVPGPVPYSKDWYYIPDDFWIALWIFR